MAANPFQELPLELLKPIFQCLANKDLVAVMLTCKSFLETGRSCLYSAIGFCYLSMPKKGDEWMICHIEHLEAQRRELWALLCESKLHASYIKSLTLLTWLPYQSTEPSTVFPYTVQSLYNNIAPQNLRRLHIEFQFLPNLQIFPGLEELDLNLDGWFPMEMPMPHSVILPSLKSTCLYWTIKYSNKLEKIFHNGLLAFFHIISCAPYLETLEILCFHYRGSRRSPPFPRFERADISEEKFAPVLNFLQAGPFKVLRNIGISFPIYTYGNWLSVKNPAGGTRDYTLFELIQEILKKASGTIDHFYWGGPMGRVNGVGLTTMSNLKGLYFSFPNYWSGVEPTVESLGEVDYLDRTTFLNKTSLRELKLAAIPLNSLEGCSIKTSLHQFENLTSLDLSKLWCPISNDKPVYLYLFGTQNMKQLSAILPPVLGFFRLSFNEPNGKSPEEFNRKNQCLRELFHHHLYLHTLEFEAECTDHDDTEPNMLNKLILRRVPGSTNDPANQSKKLQIHHIIQTHSLEDSILGGDRQLHSRSEHLLPSQNYQGPDADELQYGRARDGGDICAQRRCAVTQRDETECFLFTAP